MQPQAIFGISVLLGFVVWGMIGARYIWPALRGRPRAEALRPVLLLHAFRYVGLAFLVPGVVSPDLPDAFARPAAYGDLATSLLALLGIATLGSRLGTIVVWVFNIVGTVDLLNAFYQGDRLGLGIAPGLQGAAYFIPTVLVPLLLVTHALVFRILIRPTLLLSAPKKPECARSDEGEAGRDRRTGAGDIRCSPRLVPNAPRHASIPPASRDRPTSSWQDEGL